MTRGFRHEFGKRTVFGGLGLTAEPAQTVDASESDDAISTIDAPGADSMRRSDTDAPDNLSGRDLSRDLNGSPLPMGSAGRPKDVPPPGRSLTEPAEPENESSGGQRALNVLKQALPLMQKLLPLIDGNIAMALGNLLTPRPQSHVQVDLTPLESQVTRMQAMQQDLRGHITEHNTALKRVEDQLEMVKEASDRNTREQQEMIEDLRAIGSKVNLFAAILFGLLLVSVILNLFLFMHIRQVLP
jgi:hypothetical protein